MKFSFTIVWHFRTIYEKKIMGMFQNESNGAFSPYSALKNFSHYSSLFVHSRTWNNFSFFRNNEGFFISYAKCACTNCHHSSEIFFIPLCLTIHHAAMTYIIHRENNFWWRKKKKKMLWHLDIQARTLRLTLTKICWLLFCTTHLPFLEIFSYSI